MKTIISIGIALIFGWAVAGQGTVKAQNTDTYAYNPYTMSKKPQIQDNMSGGMQQQITYPGRIFPPYVFPSGPNAGIIAPHGNGYLDEIPYYPNSAIVSPNNDPILDAMPKISKASYVVRQHKPY